MNYIKHEVKDMLPGSVIQQCIHCGAFISDYTGMMQPVSDPPPKGFPAGPVYVSTDQTVSRMSTVVIDKDRDTSYACNDEKHS